VVNAAVLACSVPDLPAFGRSTEFLTYLPSKLSCEFSQLKRIGKGADGRVYQVLDRQAYYIQLCSNYSSDLLPPTNGDGNVSGHVCLSVCLCANF